MFIPFLAATAIAATFGQLGAMSVRIAMLTGALNFMMLVLIAIALYSLWRRYKAQA